MSMFEAASAVVTAVLKVGVPIYVAILIATASLIFFPDSVTRQLGVIEFRDAYRGYIGGGLIASASLLAAYGLTGTSRIITNRLHDRRLRHLTLETLRMLTEEEKEFLRPFIRDGRNTLHTRISDGVAGGLETKRIIFRSSNILREFMAPYNLQPMARSILAKNPRLLD